MRQFATRILAGCLVFYLALISHGNAQQFGSFGGSLEVSMQGPREATLLKDFWYRDPSGFKWTAPKGTVVDGASIPRMFWTAGSPWVGSYRQASVVHDYYCQTKDQPWQKVHEMFYFASLAGGTSKIQAKTMYAAIVYFGPKWKIEDGVDGKVLFEWQNQFDEKSYDQLEKWVKENDPPLSEIEALVQ